MSSCTRDVFSVHSVCRSVSVTQGSSFLCSPDLWVSVQGFSSLWQIMNKSESGRKWNCHGNSVSDLGPLWEMMSCDYHTHRSADVTHVQQKHTYTWCCSLNFLYKACNKSTDLLAFRWLFIRLYLRILSCFNADLSSAARGASVCSHLQVLLQIFKSVLQPGLSGCDLVPVKWLHCSTVCSVSLSRWNTNCLPAPRFFLAHLLKLNQFVPSVHKVIFWNCADIV